MFANLGIKKIRIPCLWEMVAPIDLDRCNWDQIDEQLAQCKKFEVTPVVHFLHHGSGPTYTSLIDPDFPEKFATYARSFAKRYPWIEDYSLINEIFLTARLSCLEEEWYPHLNSKTYFLKAIYLQCKASVLAMREIRRINPRARMIQTEELDQSPKSIKYKTDLAANFKWLALDLLCGKIDEHQNLYGYLIRGGLTEQEILWFKENECPPSLIGINLFDGETKENLPMPLAILVAMLGSGLAAVLVERLIYRPIRNQGRIPALITAIGTSLLFQYAGQFLFGAEPKTIPPFMVEKFYNFSEITISNIQIAVFIITMMILLFLWWLTNFTKIGKAMRATSFNINAAELMGINTNHIISFTFFLGAAIAGLTGMLISYTMSIEPLMGTQLGLKAFVAAVVGGIGIVPGAALGGFILGIAENLVAGLYKSSFRDAVSFLILILILLIKPSGILGKNTKEKV
jgi:branched-chain amino acid transport system permease protein